MMNKIEFFHDLEEIITDKICIGLEIEDLNEEIQQNTWSISMSEEVAKETSVAEFIDFFDKVIANRQKQVQESVHQSDMFFYAWVDSLSAQFKFSLISTIHEKLPFGCKLEILDDIHPIIASFLNNPYRNGIRLKEDTRENQEEEEHVLSVFLLTIKK